MAPRVTSALPTPPFLLPHTFPYFFAKGKLCADSQGAGRVTPSAPFSNPKKEQLPSPTPEDSSRPCLVTCPALQSWGSVHLQEEEDRGKYPGQAKIVATTVLYMAAVFKHEKLLRSK